MEQEISQFKQDLAKAREEFSHKEQTLTTGYLVLVDTQVLHLATKKEWEAVKSNYPRTIQFGIVDLEQWQKRFTKNEEIKEITLARAIL